MYIFRRNLLYYWTFTWVSCKEC